MSFSKSSLLKLTAKDPTDPPSQQEELTGPTEDYQKEDDQKPSGEFIAGSFEFLNRSAVVTSS